MHLPQELLEVIHAFYKARILSISQERISTIAAMPPHKIVAYTHNREGAHPQLCIVDFNSGAIEHRLPLASRKWIAYLLPIPHGVVMIDFYKMVDLWDPTTTKGLKQLPVTQVSAFCYLPATKKLLLGHTFGKISIVDLHHIDESLPYSEARMRDGHIVAMAVHHNQLITVHSIGSIVYGSLDGQEVAGRTTLGIPPPKSIYFKPTHHSLVILAPSQQLWHCRLPDRAMKRGDHAKVSHIEEAPRKRSFLRSICPWADGTALLSNDGVYLLGKEHMKAFPLEIENPTSICPLPGQGLAVGNSQGEVHIFDSSSCLVVPTPQ